MPVGLSYRTLPMHILFFTLASLSHFHRLLRRNPGKKIRVVAMGPQLLLLAVCTLLLYPSTVTLNRLGAELNEDSGRMMMTVPPGLTLRMLLRVYHASVPPFFTDPSYGNVCSILVGLGFTTDVYRRAMMANPLKEEVNW
ncbi:hypothetical protein Q4I32_005102 [Leishmania shawi]|uniref:Uncharacterized protein n=1 Tax=Leishmania shawi TaxID=5680 RepID=A0AAW3BP19_9TRYP